MLDDYETYCEKCTQEVMESLNNGEHKMRFVEESVLSCKMAYIGDQNYPFVNSFLERQKDGTYQFEFLDEFIGMLYKDGYKYYNDDIEITEYVKKGKRKIRYNGNIYNLYYTPIEGCDYRISKNTRFNDNMIRFGTSKRVIRGGSYLLHLENNTYDFALRGVPQGYVHKCGNEYTGKTCDGEGINITINDGMISYNGTEYYAIY